MRCGVAANLLSFDHHFKRITSRWWVRIWQTFQVDLTCGAIYPETGSVTRLTTYDTIGDAGIVTIIGPLESGSVLKFTNEEQMLAYNDIEQLNQLTQKHVAKSR